MSRRFLVLACAAAVWPSALPISSAQAPKPPAPGAVVSPWLRGPMRLEVRNEVTNAASFLQPSPGADMNQPLERLGLAVAGHWTQSDYGSIWNLEFTGSEKRVGHTVTIDLPVLSATSVIFTPTERGMMSAAVYPTYRPVEYAHLGWGDGRYYVLPLVSVFDPAADRAITVALPPDANIPHLQVEWLDAKTLRVTLAHRGMGGGKASPLRVLFYTHPADYRSVLKVYSDQFPRHFQPPMPRGMYEGTFWYHHIHAHPDPEEMKRQNARFIWTSFWFTHLGEYLPAEKEWFPYTYAKWWCLKEPMNDAKIRAFARKMHEQGIGVFAYFNVTEYGGAGGRGGDTAAAAKILQEQFANALMKDAAGHAIPTWEGAMAMNARRDCALFPALAEQVRRHVARLPELDGFVIDRLDWGSLYDYGHDDGLTMVGPRPAENMAGPVGEGVAEVCRQAHEAKWRVYVNQFWRLEMLREVDGYCHEDDYPRGLGYLAPFRPASAWHHRKPYQGDLLQFEAQLKQRLQFALQPQMIAHEFPISQQPPDARAADLLEIYAPLMAALDGKQQVLLPHCIEATGPNDANLFVNRAGQYVIPVTSRMRFLSRPPVATTEVKVTLRVPDAADLAWATLISADGPGQDVCLSRFDGRAEITAPHGTASMIIVGKGTRPPRDEKDAARIRTVRDRLFPPLRLSPRSAPASPPESAVGTASIKVKGANVGEPGTVRLIVGGKTVGRVNDGISSFALQMPPKPSYDVELATGDEGTWFVPQRIVVAVPLADGKKVQTAEWTTGDRVEALHARDRLRFALHWTAPSEAPKESLRFNGLDANTAGAWKGKFGTRAAWVPRVTSAEPQNGFQLQPGGQVCLWKDGVSDDRVPQMQASSGAARRATCWFTHDNLSFTVIPADRKPYRLTVYLLDYDRNGRAVEATLEDSMGLTASQQKVSKALTARGVYLSWTVAGEATLTLKKLAGYNVAASGIFVDSPQ